MTIERWRGSAKGRNRAVRHGGLVYTVATAPGADIQAQTRAALAVIDANLADAGSDKTGLLSVQIFLVDLPAAPRDARQSGDTRRPGNASEGNQGFPPRPPFLAGVGPISPTLC